MFKKKSAKDAPNATLSRSEYREKMRGTRGFIMLGLGAGDGDAARLDDEHVALDQLFRQGDMAEVLLDLGVVAADDAGAASDLACQDDIEQGPQAATERALDRLDQEAAVASTGESGMNTRS